MTPTQEERGAVRPVRAGRDRPIIFSAPMVRALLDRRKTQARWIVKRPTDHFHGSYTHVHQDGAGFVWSDGKGGCQRVARLHARILSSTMGTMRQLWEEVTGAGFYRPDREAAYVASAKACGVAFDENGRPVALPLSPVRTEDGSDA